MTTNASTIGRCPNCNERIPSTWILIEYENDDGTTGLWVEMDGRKLRKYGVGCRTSGTVGTVDPRLAYGTYGNVGRRFFVMFPGWGNQRQTLL